MIDDRCEDCPNRDEDFCMYYGMRFVTIDNDPDFDTCEFIEEESTIE